MCSSKQFGVRENGCVRRFRVVTVSVSSGMHRGKFNDQLIIINFAEMMFLSACLNGRSVTLLWRNGLPTRQKECSDAHRSAVVVK